MIQDTPTNDFRFKECLTNNTLKLKPAQIDTLQINITKLCNQACRHCHVDASPKRKETMSKETIDKCLIVLKDNPQIINLDITGGAPELNPNFDYLVVQAKELEKHIIVRHNLTVTFDGHPHTSESKEYLPQFFAENKVEVISSLPCYQENSTNRQRGKGVFNKSIQAIKQLNGLGLRSGGGGSGV